MQSYTPENLGTTQLKPIIVGDDFPLIFDPFATNEIPIPNIGLANFVKSTSDISSNSEFAHRLFGLNNREVSIQEMPPAMVVPGECVTNIPQMLHRTNNKTIEYSWTSRFLQIKGEPIIEHTDIIEGTAQDTGEEDYKRRKSEKNNLFHQHTHPTKVKRYLHFLPSPGDIRAYAELPEVANGMIISGEYEQPNGDWVSGFSLIVPTKKVYKPSLRDRILKPTPPRPGNMTYSDLIHYAEEMGFTVYLYSTLGKWSDTPESEFEYPFLLKRLTTE